MVAPALQKDEDGKSRYKTIARRKNSQNTWEGATEITGVQEEVGGSQREGRGEGGRGRGVVT